jgi:hypothetical protein
MRRKLRTIVAVVALLCAAEARAVPFHGCTFFRAPLSAATMACAQFTFLWGECTLVRGFISYPGVVYFRWMPEYFIEVTNRAGKSAFATPDAPGLIRQMAVADGAWTTHGTIPDASGVSASHDLPQGGHNFSTWFGRALPVPYGSSLWRIEAVGDSAGGNYPRCFSGITEYAAETWADGLDSADRGLAEFWASTKAFFACPIAGMGGATQEAALPAIMPCARNLSAGEQKIAAYAGPSVEDPTRVCMGQLGGLLPRTGLTEGSHFTAAERVAWRTANLSEEFFHTGVGVEMGDKWQIVHPVGQSSMCFPPGSMARPTPVMIPLPELFPTRVVPLYDSNLTPPEPGKQNTEYVFAVWRKKVQCIEVAQAIEAEGEIALFMTARSGICTALGAMTGPP